MSRSPQRKPLEWPNGARVALILTFNLETWDLTKDTDKPYYAGGPAILPDILPGNTPDFPNYTWREYGQRVGIWRLFELFDELGVKASCTTNAVTFERRKAMTDAVLERGWELLTHNWEQGELLTNFAQQTRQKSATSCCAASTSSRNSPAANRRAGCRRRCAARCRPPTSSPNMAALSTATS